MRRKMKWFTMALSLLLCSVPLCTSASVAPGSLLATMGTCMAHDPSAHLQAILLQMRLKKQEG